MRGPEWEKLVEVSEKIQEDLNLFVVNIGKDPEIASVDIVIPEEFRNLYGGPLVRVVVAPGRTDQWVTLQPGGELVKHDAAMMEARQVQAPGGIRLDARDLDIRQKGSWEGEWNIPKYLEQINPEDVQGVVPFILEQSVWHRPQFTQ